MAIEISRYGNIIEKLMFGDKCSVKRVTGNDENPFDNPTNRIPVKGLEDIPCKISYSRPDTPASTNGFYNISNRIVTLFVPLRYHIVEGDYIIATRTHKDGRVDVVKGICNLPDVFDTHQQILIKEHEPA